MTNLDLDMVDGNCGGKLRFIYLCDREMENQLYDLQSDYGQTHNLLEEEPQPVEQLKEKMREAMAAHDAPADRYQRMGL